MYLVGLHIYYKMIYGPYSIMIFCILRILPTTAADFSCTADMSKSFTDETSNIAICVRRVYKLRGNRSRVAIRSGSSSLVTASYCSLL